MQPEGDGHRDMMDAWGDGRVVYSDRLESDRARNGPGGSNPSLPAFDIWMGGRAVECIRLETGSPPKTGIVGSNPTPSAEVV